MSFMGGGRFLSIMLGQNAFYFGKGDSFFLLCNHFLDRTALFRRRRRSQFMSELSLVR